MAFGPVQSGSNNTATVTLAGVTSGNTIVATCTTSPGIGSPTVTCADNHSNSYTQVDVVGSSTKLWVFYLLNATAGSNVITFSYTGGGLTINSCMAREYTAAYASALDKHTYNSYSGGPQTTMTSNASSTLTQALETVIGTSAAPSSLTITAGTGFANLLEQADSTVFSLAMEDQPVNSTTGIAATFGTTIATTYYCHVMTFLSTYTPPAAGVHLLASTGVGT